MTIQSYSDLQTEVIANSGRSDLGSRIPTFIQMAEATMQRVLKTVDFESTATVSCTDGVGALPAGFAGHRAAYFDGDERRPLGYITPDRMNGLDDRITLPSFYTVVGSNLLLMSRSTGDVVLTYNARFTPLSDSNTTNALLTQYPDVYFLGTLMYLYHHVRNWQAKAEQKAGFEMVIDQIISDYKDRKYPGPLQVRPR